LSSIYDPYRSDVEEQHRYSLRHKYTATAYPRGGTPFELDVEDCSISFDKSWVPFVQADMTIKVYADQATLDLLDPNKGCRVKIYAGYIYDGTVEDVKLLADLHLRTSTIDRPADTIKLSLTSDEALAEDAKRMAWAAQAPLTGINEFVSFHATKASLPDTAVVVSDMPALYGATELAGMVQDVGQDSLSMIQDAAERLNLWIYCDGNRYWRIQKKTDYAGTSALKLLTGPSGTILSASTYRTRGDSPGRGFHNSVALKYMWTDSGGVDRVVFGNAVVSTGAYASASVGYNTFYEERKYPIANATLANAAASNLLKVLVGRGYQSVVTAHAAYWLRPGHTVTLLLPAGTQQRFIVNRVDFKPVDGSMTVNLHQPFNVTISTTSG
jgi:hypothetical protein